MRTGAGVRTGDEQVGGPLIGAYQRGGGTQVWCTPGRSAAPEWLRQGI